MHRRRRDALGDVAVEFRNRRIDAVAGMDETGIGAEPAGEIVDRLITANSVREPHAAAGLGRLFRELALVISFERRAFGVDLVEIPRNLRRVDRRVEIRKIPFRQLAPAIWPMISTPACSPLFWPERICAKQFCEKRSFEKAWQSEQSQVSS